MWMECVGGIEKTYIRSPDGISVNCRNMRYRNNINILNMCVFVQAKCFCELLSIEQET